MKAIILFSGGLDSTVLLAMAKKKGRECIAISFDYSQRHRLELRAAQAICRHYRIDHKILKIDSTLFGTSSLVSQNPVQKGKTTEQISQTSFPSTYVPARNTLFLAHAMGQAELIDAQEIHYGANFLDAVPYPDCRPCFIEAFQQVLKTGTQQSVAGSPPQLIAPFVEMDKTSIIKLGSELDAPLHLSLSCYDPTSLGHHCGSCEACTLRKEGFEKAQVRDSTTYKE